MSADQRAVHARLTSTTIDGCDRLQIRELRGREAISEPFAFDLDVIIPDDTSFGAPTVLGKDVTIVFSVGDDDVRSVHGIVSDITDQPYVLQGFTRHQLHVVPRVHRLSLSRTCEVFLKKSVIDIALDKLARVNIGAEDVALHLQNPPKATEFRLQYAETDFAFVSRHLEHAGIAYWFDHSGAQDVLVLSDNNTAFPAATGPEAIPYVGVLDERGIKTFEVKASMVTANHVVNDYVEANPKLDLNGESSLGVPFPGEIVDFGTGHATPADAKAIAQMRGLARQALADGFEGTSSAPYIEAARTIAVEGAPGAASPMSMRSPGQSSSRLLVVWVEHHLTQTTLMHDEHMIVGYGNRFRAVPASRDYRPALVTPWPHIAGFVYAVTDEPPPGASELTAVLDEDGRYTIRFYFDRADGAKRQMSSARVRMMQPHAGGGYGTHFPLKPGVEVMVAFIEGDPDRPIIAGAMHNGLNKHVVTSKNPKVNHIQTRSGIRFSMKDS
jgi:type VI secretion system secreted protein VgrG